MRIRQLPLCRLRLYRQPCWSFWRESFGTRALMSSCSDQSHHGSNKIFFVVVIFRAKLTLTEPAVLIRLTSYSGCSIQKHNVKVVLLCCFLFSSVKLQHCYVEQKNVTKEKQILNLGQTIPFRGNKTFPFSSFSFSFLSPRINLPLVL